MPEQVLPFSSLGGAKANVSDPGWEIRERGTVDEDNTAHRDDDGRRVLLDTGAL